MSERDYYVVELLKIGAISIEFKQESIYLVEEPLLLGYSKGGVINDFLNLLRVVPQHAFFRNVEADSILGSRANMRDLDLNRVMVDFRPKAFVLLAKIAG